MDRKNEGNAGCSIFGEYAIFKEPWIIPVRMEESGLDNACDYLRENLFSQFNMEEEKDSRPLKLLQYLCSTAPCMIVRVCNWKEPLYVPIGSEFKKRHEPACKFRSDPGPYMAITNLDSLLGELALRRYLLDKLRYLKSGKSVFGEYEQIPPSGKCRPS